MDNRPGGSFLHPELIFPANDLRVQVRDFSGPAGKALQAAVTRHELRLVTADFLVPERHQIAFAERAVRFQAERKAADRREKQTARSAFRQQRRGADRIDDRPAHPVEVEAARQGFDDRFAVLPEHVVDASGGDPRQTFLVLFLFLKWHD